MAASLSAGSLSRRLAKAAGTYSCQLAMAALASLATLIRVAARSFGERPQTNMRILGIDPGLDITGYGVIEDKADPPAVIEAGTVKTSHKDGLTERLNIIYSQVTDIIKETGPDICVIEELYSHYKHPMTAILMAHARGVVLSCCSHSNLRVVDYPSKTVKCSVTGYGNASKQQIQRVVSKLLNLKEAPNPVDITDALALCLTHLHHVK